MQIDDGVAMPLLARTRYPFEELEVGQSFVITDASRAALHRLRVAAAYWSNKLDASFVVRPVPEGVRAWRVC